MNKVNEKDENIGWNFDNSYLQLPDKLYADQSAGNFPNPKLIMLNKSLAERLELTINKFNQDRIAEVLVGNNIPENAAFIAQAYAGHQFGHFTMLGDGRASLLGEHVTSNGKRYDIHFKGSGKTKYSRGGDGLATLGPMLREYLISEGLHHLGIPTTRSLAVATTGEKVMRENPLQGAVLTRVASSHIRVGTFQYIRSFGSRDELQSLANYTITRHYPKIAEEENPYLGLLREVVKQQAKLIAKWQLVGFIHGVMNTDNMTISGESIDFGPCAFMDTYDPTTVFSSIDTYGRYAYKNQPNIAAWNLSRFADTLLPLIHEDQQKAIKLATEEVSNFYDEYDCAWLNGMRAKLGLFNKEDKDEALIKDLLLIMQKYEADYTNTFRSLTIGILDEIELFQTKEFKDWHEKWKTRQAKQAEGEEEIIKLMKQNNPSIIPRNHHVEEALEAAVLSDDMTVIKQLLTVLKKPYAYSADQNEYTRLPPNSLTPYQTYCGT